MLKFELSAFLYPRKLFAKKSKKISAGGFRTADLCIWALKASLLTVRPPILERENCAVLSQTDSDFAATQL